MHGSDAPGGIPLELSLPKASFVSESEFRRERDLILFADWFCVGRTDSLTKAGDFLTAEVVGESVIVVRGDDGGLRGFYNLCRHRGSRLVPPEDAAPASTGGEPGRTGCFAGAIKCPYHAWTYGLDGTLRSAPFLPDLRKHRATLSLHRVEVDAWGGFVFARLEPGTGSSLRESLGPIPARVAPYRLEDLRTGARLSYDVAANWKVVLENYNECYHCGPVHPELCELVPDFASGGGDLDWESGIPHRQGAYTFTATGTTMRQPLPGLSEAERTRHFGELVLPNLMFSLSADHVAAFTLWPRSAGLTTIICDFLFHPHEIAKPDFDPDDAVSFWDLVNRQDWLICERVQDGMTSRRFTAGYLAPMEEPSADVRKYVAARLGQRQGGD
ncbi:MAG: aromatic ring-hydroxylating dioxygenase subunit alpha [Nocardiopsaceae bacterium]|nr:aromatic ring-hydroxylating dioxygenase subunit alpha [Nocardiopsaceae bacterium]